MKVIIKILKSPILYLTIISVGFFFVYSYPRIVSPLVNLSPDENANYFFSKLYAEKNSLMSYERLNEGIEPIVHPRSINVNRENYLVPGSFLGIILLYGTLAKIFGSNIIIFLTPFFACLSALFFYGIIKCIFSWKVAFISACLMLAHPAFWYYSTRSMFHNTLFVSLLLVGIYFLIISRYLKHSIAVEDKLQIKKREIFFRYGSIILAGLFIGLALIVRTAEAPWVMGMLFIIWIFNFKKIKFFEIVLMVAIIILTAIPIAYLNQSLYGSPLLTGYANLYDGADSNKYFAKVGKIGDGDAQVNEENCLNSIDGVCKIEFTKSNAVVNEIMPVFFVSSKSIREKIKKIIIENIPTSFTLNLNIKTATKNFKNYYLKFFEWLSALTIVGIIFFIIYYLGILMFSFYKAYLEGADHLIMKIDKKHTKQRELEVEITRDSFCEKWKTQFIYLALFVCISAYLVIYYGSWVFYDTPDKKLITIGTSYTRYWLPIYIMGLPFISFLFVKISDIFKFKLPKFIFLFIVSAILIAYCGLFVYFAPFEGINTQVKGFVEYNYKREKVLELTEKDAVIIGAYYDKIFFPDRKVIASKMYDDETVKSNLPVLVSRTSVYYYSFGLKQDDIDFINRVYLADYGVELSDEQNIFADEVLWKIVKK